MKKMWTGVAIGLVLITLALVIARLKTRSLNVAIQNNGSVQKSTVVSKSTGFGPYLKTARPSYRKTLEQDPQIPAVCMEYFDALQRIDFIGDETQQLTYQMLPQAPQNCVGEFVHGYNAVQQDYLKKCAPKENLSESISEECTNAVFMMRAAVTRLALKNKPIKDIADLSQLTDLIFSELAGSFTPGATPDFTKMREISERMLELDPKLYAAHKMNVMSNLMEAMVLSKQNPAAANEAWNQTETALAKAKELRPEEHSLDDAELAAKTRGFDPVTMMDVSQQMTNQNPENDRGWYLMAFAEWKQGDHDSSMVNLRRAISLAPGNQEYQKILQEISKPNANGDSFQGALSIRIGNDDFNH